MKKWQKEIDYIRDNITQTRFDNERNYVTGLRARYNFNYNAMLDNRDFYFILTTTFSIIEIIIMYNKKRIYIYAEDFKENEIKKVEKDLVNRLINFYARKIYYDKSLNIIKGMNHEL